MKITRIAVILLLGILLVSGVACCPQGAGPEATPTPTPTPTATNVYSKFGFSFEHPPGVTPTEEGIYSATADEDSGMVNWWVGDDVFGLGWFKSEVYTSMVRDMAIDYVFGILESEGAVTEPIGGKVSTQMSGYDVIYQLFGAVVPMTEGKDLEYNGLIALWYCQPGTRVFVAMFFVSGDPLPYLEDFMPTFSCQ